MVELQYKEFGPKSQEKSVCAFTKQRFQIIPGTDVCHTARNRPKTTLQF